MKNVLIILSIVIVLTSCEDKITENTAEYTETSNICPEVSPETQVSSINFDGLKEITQISQTTATLKWKHYEGISLYSIVHISNQERKVVGVTMAPETTFKLHGLIPDTHYTYIIRAMDSRAHLDANMNTVSFKTKPWPTFNNRKSLNFNGSQSIELEQSDSYQKTNSLTLSFWMKANEKADTDTRLITFHKGNQAGTALSLSVYNEELRLHYLDKNLQLKEIKKDFDYFNNSWHHLTATISEKFISIYINGKKVLKVNGQINSFGKHPAHFGSFSGIQKGFNGKLDELGIFNKVLDKNQVLELYSNGLANDLQSHSMANSLVSWFHLGDHKLDSGQSVYDVISTRYAKTINLLDIDFTSDAP